MLPLRLVYDTGTRTGAGTRTGTGTGSGTGTGTGTGTGGGAARRSGAVPPSLLAVAVLLVAIGGLAACGGRPGGVTAGRSSTSGPGGPGGATASPDPAARTTTPGAGRGGSATGPAPTGGRTGGPAVEPLVRYTRSGGLAGFSDQLVIQQDGTFQLSRKGTVARRGRLTSAELAQVRTALAGSHFSDLLSFNMARAGADLFTYTVWYVDRQVVAQDGAVPTVLQPVLTVLGALVDRYGSG